LRPRLSINVWILLPSSFFKTDLDMLAIRSSVEARLSIPGKSQTSCNIKSLSNSQGAHECVFLLDERGELLIVWSRYAGVIDKHGAFDGWNTTCEHIEESRLSAAGGAHESQDLTLN
jgi:hypothetical protein